MFVLATCVLAALSQQALAALVRVLDVDFPDPSVIKTDEGYYYSFATAGNGVNAQIASSPDFKSWKLLNGQDAVPGPFPDWMANPPGIWAPDVIKRDDGQYVMYFSAAPKEDKDKHCIAVATSPSPKGPYTSTNSALACPLDQGGAIDSSGFQDADGTRYVVYKIDGNSIGSKSTPLMLQPLKSDGVTPDGEATKLLDRDDLDGPLIEAPSLVLRDGTYYLSFSSNLYNTKKYDTKYATASAVTGPYKKAQGSDAPLLQTGDTTSDGQKLAAPGGSDFSEDGNKIVFHAFKNGENIDQGRAMFSADITLSNGKITVD